MLNMSRAYICYKCGTECSGLGAECNMCYAAETQRQNAQRLHEESIIGQQANLRRQQYYIEQQYQQDLEHQQRVEEEQALYNRQQLHNQKLSIESNISSDDIYNYGLNYIDGAFQADNPEQLTVTVNEDGTFSGSWVSDYELAHLKQAFQRGLTQALSRYQAVDVDVLLGNARAAGRQVARGTLNPSFRLESGVAIGNTTIYTKIFNSNFKSTIDEDSGRWEGQWNPPFESSELNDQFAAGIVEVEQELNSPEAVERRLAVDIPEIRSARQQSQQELELEKLGERRRATVGKLKKITMWVLLTAVVIMSQIYIWNLFDGVFWLCGVIVSTSAVYHSIKFIDEFLGD
jgi:hypothetical protein